MAAANGNPGLTVMGVSVRVAREGWPFVAAFAAAAAGLWLLAPWLGAAGAVLAAWCVWFFRDPDRTTPVREGLAIAPADGVVQSIGDAPPPPELDMGTAPMLRIAVFMNVFDCHVNRLPHDGRIGRLAYTPGRFVNASLDKASEENERQAVRLDLPGGGSIGVVQIAGLVARRIVCRLEEGWEVRAGERFGLIRFGSRVDGYLPPGASPLVAIGQRSVAGETVLAELASDEPPRRGEVR